MGDIKTVVATQFVEDPSGASPRAGGRHVLTGGVSGLEDKTKVHSRPDLMRLQSDQPGMTGRRLCLFADLLFVRFHPADERRSLMDVGEPVRRRSGHHLSNDLGSNPAGIGDGERPSTGRRHQTPFGRREGRVDHLVDVGALDEERPGQTDGDRHRTDEIFDVARQAFGLERNVAIAVERSARLFPDPPEPGQPRTLGVIAPFGDLLGRRACFGAVLADFEPRSECRLGIAITSGRAVTVAAERGIGLTEGINTHM